MGDLDIQKNAKKEQNRLKRLLAKSKIPEEKRKILEPIITNTAWMAVKLDEARQMINDEPIVVEYDNGGGQSGVRENPALRAYESLWKSYSMGMQKLIDAMQREQDSTEDVTKEEPKERENMLQIVRARRQKEA